MVSVCIFRAVPDTQNQNAVWFGVGDEQEVIHKPQLRSHDWQALVLKRACYFPCLSPLGKQFDDAGKH